MKTGDNKLGKRDTVTLAAYREQIDADKMGVSAVESAKFSGGDFCCVCNGRVGRDGRIFWIKGENWAFHYDMQVCEACCEEARENRHDK